ncbi:LuxR C-terminal-related transcriptional regulator [Aestuariicella sp. G3-2]|uniref:LuxR C-terminal-related transcriptional regulator n=1 Tax=Pseudomaricurvus albidus TaxID=2842452 RepID=UPI001C0DC757|nr:LuxR C-terminal-related transcriptional regulator [Aestuariicella albida]MBU3068291.1 LuxR C-terminal-related transcriptional regulator [Aestuariicella albida]
MNQSYALREETASYKQDKALRTIEQLLLYTPVRSIDNILLAEDLQRQLEIPCLLTSNPQTLSKRPEPETGTPSHNLSAALLLFDCTEISVMELQNLLRLLPSDTRCALTNLVPDSIYNRMMEWPQVQGMFYRNIGTHMLLKGIRAVLNGELWIPRHLCHDFINRRRHQPSQPLIISLPTKLTRRERQVLEGIYAGKSNLALACQLKLSEHTVKSHLYSAYKKIGVTSRLKASNWLRDHYSLLDKLSSR